MEEVKRIVITGPESTGKTNIASYLATKFNSIWIPEYARYYIENLKAKYDYSDIENIARKQVEDYHHYSRNASGLVIFDTWLIITKVWFQKLYNKYPPWMEESIRNLKIDLYLLCTPDIEWKPDPLRENPGKKREILFNAYESEIKMTGAPYGIVKGSGKSRYESAERIVEQNLKI
ncbi:MAG: AAA family ATPase [Bacteroidales bacterium]